MGCAHVADRVFLPLVVVLTVFLVGWYVVGNEVMRRRARALATWCREVLALSGGRLSIQWLTTNSFRLHVEEGRAPLQTGTLTGLTEAWDVPVLWLWNRRRGRRDMVLVQLTLHRRPLFGLELYRAGSLLAGDASHAARLEGWAEEPMDEFRLAAGAGRGRDLAVDLVGALVDQRRHLVRLAVRRQAPNLSVAMNVPRSERLDPATLRLSAVLTRDARAVRAGLSDWPRCRT